MKVPSGESTERFDVLVRSMLARYGAEAVSCAAHVSPDDVVRWSQGVGSITDAHRRALYYLCIEKRSFDLMDIAFPARTSVNLREKTGIELCGFKVRSPFGIAACFLTGWSDGIEYFASREYDILTYKTVRSTARPPLPAPNWAFLRPDVERTVMPPFDQYVTADSDYFPSDARLAGMANSQGVASREPEEWQPDVEKAKRSLRKGQVLIVSVTATARPGNRDKQAIIDDFVAVARMAKDAGADIVEANYSCPNLGKDKVGVLYQDPEQSGIVSAEVKRALGTTPLIVKIGYLNDENLSRFVRHNRHYIDGIVAINTIRMEVRSPDGKEVFPGRLYAGVSGIPVRQWAMEVVRNLVRLREDIPGKHFAILATGGVTSPQDVFDYLKLGANAVQCCTAAYVDPSLAHEVGLYAKRHEE